MLIIVLVATQHPSAFRNSVSKFARPAAIATGNYAQFRLVSSLIYRCFSCYTPGMVVVWAGEADNPGIQSTLTIEEWAYKRISNQHED